MAAAASASVQRMNALSDKLRSDMPEPPVPSPGAAKGRAKAPPSAMMGRRGVSGHLSTDAGQLANDFETIRHRYEEVLKENETLKAEQKRRMESYMRRETNYQSEVEDLKAELERQGKGRPPEDLRIKDLRRQHGKVIDTIGSMQSREQLALQEQEKDLLRAFRARLWDVQVRPPASARLHLSTAPSPFLPHALPHALPRSSPHLHAPFHPLRRDGAPQFELESERSKKDDGALEWIEKTKTLSKELDWSRDEALRLDRMNQFLTKENARLKVQMRSQEDDREFIVRQMLTLKKENSRLKATAQSDDREAAAAAASTAASSPDGRSQSAGVRRGAGASQLGVDRPMTAGAAAFRGIEDVDGAGGAAGGASSLASSERIKELTLQQAESEERYREVVARLKRLLDVERRNLRAVRAAHAKDLQSRSELETLLRACVDDVRKEIAAQRGSAASPKGSSSSSRLVGVDELGPKERERVLELLLSQERVVSLLYDRTFPAPPASTGVASPEREEGEEGGDMVAGDEGA